MARRPCIYRVQDKFGRGPWKPGFSMTWVEDRSDEEYAALMPGHHQFPKMDGMTFLADRHYGFGCESLEQLRRWIRKSEYETLRRHGYRAYKLYVDRILFRSDVQVVFERSQPLSVSAKGVSLYA
ncbi:MAG: hypothetical protein E6Q97_39635 [Desulfurellales bacterium]|nr:MAG: hypothetical protein E6Q97_39635 [Desulfurellales bacterium]